MKALRVRWGRNVARRRRALGLSQAELAGMCGLTQQSVSSIERAEHGPSDAVKLKMARALHQPVEVLFPFQLKARPKSGVRKGGR